VLIIWAGLPSQYALSPRGPTEGPLGFMALNRVWNSIRIQTVRTQKKFRTIRTVTNIFSYQLYSDRNQNRYIGKGSIIERCIVILLNIITAKQYFLNDRQNL
jgi:hypothetical protein